jgi:Tfp pilus assembly protein PilX
MGDEPMRNGIDQADKAVSGVALLSVLLFLLLIAIVTVSAMGIVRSDLAAGIRQQQAVQVFNVAEAGVHYAIARMQTSGADTYTGETVTITDGDTTIGQAVVEVRCLDNITSPKDGACSGAEPAYRRIISTGTLTVAGPTRVVTAVVEGTTSPTSTYAVCAYDSLSVDQQVTIYGSIGSNGNITLLGPAGDNRSAVCDSKEEGGLVGRCRTPIPVPPTEFSAGATAGGDITCSQGCENQVEGDVHPNQPVGSVCPAVSLTPPSDPGTTSLRVRLGETVKVDPAVNYGAVTLDDTPGNPDSCPIDSKKLATLYIDSGSDENAPPVTVRMATLNLGKCSRLEIRGKGRVVMWLLEPTNQALSAVQRSVFGTTSTTPGEEKPVEGNRFTVNVVSTNSAAIYFNQSGMIAATFLVPNGGFRLKQAQITNGAILAKNVQFDQGTTFTWDPRSRIGVNRYTNFITLRSWKDQ